MSIKCIIDPLKDFKSVEPVRLLEACGLLTSFAYEALLEVPEGSAEDVYTLMVSIYGFGDMRMKGGTVSPEGVYKYPEDPELKPLAVIQYEGAEGTKVYIYQYGIVAVQDNEATIVARMD